MGYTQVYGEKDSSHPSGYLGQAPNTQTSGPLAVNPVCLTNTVCVSCYEKKLGSTDLSQVGQNHEQVGTHILQWEMAPFGFSVPSVGTTGKAGNLESGAVFQTHPLCMCDFKQIIYTFWTSISWRAFFSSWICFLFKLASFGLRGKPWTKWCPHSLLMLMSSKSIQTCFL